MVYNKTGFLTNPSAKTNGLEVWVILPRSKANAIVGQLLAIAL
jgi:hypothetical protein